MRLFKRIVGALADPSKSYEERTYVMLSILGVSSMFIALFFDMLGQENPVEVITIACAILFIPLVVALSVHFRRVQIGSFVTVCALVLIILPVTFFRGGGIKGGGVYWIIFSYMFIGMSLSGRLRVLMMTVLTSLAAFEFWSAFRHPEWIYQHTLRMNIIDGFVSVLLVGLCVYLMLMYQKAIFTDESNRAHAEAKRAEELNLSQNHFFSSMSHEIRTPINSILGLNELILRDQSASDDVVRDAAGIQGSGKMLLALINDILDFSKMEAGSMDIIPVDYRVGDMVSEIVNMLWLKAHDKDLGFEVTVDPDVPSVLYGDEVRIKQVLINLLNNAVKYTQKGRVGLRVESRDVDDDTIDLIISVSDTGMGIKKEDIPYLFDAFKRVDEGKNRHIEGTGLGLSIVKQLVELMDGTVGVSSIYGEGTTFTVTFKQKVTDRTGVGELNIHNQQMERSAYESSFLAPEARILIVDDNEMNLEVESRLLEDTDMGIDTAMSGKEALEMCLKVHYDTIFMDHLMPGMDGIECLEALRNQAGGLNRNTPVIVLTANAGSSNRELYNRAGFDGYLVKPVSGAVMEETLIRHISSDKIILRNMMMADDEEIHTSDRYAEKVPVIITSSSMCDLPDSVIRKLHIPIIPFTIRTEEGEFKDGVHIDANEFIRHVNKGKEAVSSPPSEADYTEFFADILKRTHHIIHISISTSMSEDYLKASEAAKSFDNVTVVNSEAISSATGILVLIAYKLVQQGLQVGDIISELEEVKHRLKCSFIIDTTDYMAKKGLVSNRLKRAADALSLHPALRIRNDKVEIRGVWFGRTKRAYGKYLNRALPTGSVPDSDIIVIDYADVPVDTLKWIEDEIRKTNLFEHIVLQQASAAISTNCGPGALGIMYFLKSEKSYNIASYIDELNEAGGASEKETADSAPSEDGYGNEEEADPYADPGDFVGNPMYSEPVPAAELSEPKWYQFIDNIDPEIALKNSGSEDAFKSVLGIFYSSIPEKQAELEKYYSSEDWENYTIKIHALKSSARLIGATELGENARLLEEAGKEGNIQYIKDNHDAVLADYLVFREELAPLFAEDPDSDEDVDKPLADEALIERIYEELRGAADDMDCSLIDDILKEIEPYEIPASEKERFRIIRERAASFDYSGILEVL